MAFCAAIGMIHCEGIALLTGPGVIFGTVYLTVAALLFMKGHFFEPGSGQRA